MQDTPGENEYMKDRVIMWDPVPAEKDHAQRICNSPCYDQHDRYDAYRVEQRPDGKNADPAHHKIRNHRNGRKPVAKHEFYQNSDYRQGPNGDQQILPERTFENYQAKRRIASGDQ